MRFWIVIVLAISVALSTFTVAGTAFAMAGSGCAGKADHGCPCKQAPKNCMDACATATAEVGVFSGLILTGRAVIPRFVRALSAPLTPKSIEQGLDPPVPRA